MFKLYNTDDTRQLELKPKQAFQKYFFDDNFLEKGKKCNALVCSHVSFTFYPLIMIKLPPVLGYGKYRIFTNNGTVLL